MIIQKYKKIFTIFICLAILFSAVHVFAFSTNPNSQFALPTYQALEPEAFGDVITVPAGQSSFGVFLGQVFNFGIAAAVALALIMIIWGGIEYMTTDAWQNKEDGKKRIMDALYGLGLALISYLILFTINPCLVDFTGSAGCATKNSFLDSNPTANLNSDLGVTIPTFSDNYNSQTGILENMGSQAAGKQTIINNTSVQPNPKPKVIDCYSVTSFCN